MPNADSSPPEIPLQNADEGLALQCSEGFEPGTGTVVGTYQLSPPSPPNPQSFQVPDAESLPHESLGQSVDEGPVLQRSEGDDSTAVGSPHRSSLGSQTSGPPSVEGDTPEYANQDSLWRYLMQPAVQDPVRPELWRIRSSMGNGSGIAGGTPFLSAPIQGTVSQPPHIGLSPASDYLLPPANEDPEHPDLLGIGTGMGQ